MMTAPTEFMETPGVDSRSDKASFLSRVANGLETAKERLKGDVKDLGELVEGGAGRVGAKMVSLVEVTNPGRSLADRFRPLAAHGQDLEYRHDDLEAASSAPRSTVTRASPDPPSLDTSSQSSPPGEVPSFNTSSQTRVFSGRIDPYSSAPAPTFLGAGIGSSAASNARKLWDYTGQKLQQTVGAGGEEKYDHTHRRGALSLLNGLRPREELPTHAKASPTPNSIARDVGGSLKGADLSSLSNLSSQLAKTECFSTLEQSGKKLDRLGRLAFKVAENCIHSRAELKSKGDRQSSVPGLSEKELMAFKPKRRLTCAFTVVLSSALLFFLFWSQRSTFFNDDYALPAPRIVSLSAEDPRADGQGMGGGDGERANDGMRHRRKYTAEPFVPRNPRLRQRPIYHQWVPGGPSLRWLRFNPIRRYVFVFHEGNYDIEVALKHLARQGWQEPFNFVSVPDLSRLSDFSTFLTEDKEALANYAILIDGFNQYRKYSLSLQPVLADADPSLDAAPNVGSTDQANEALQLKEGARGNRHQRQRQRLTGGKASMKAQEIANYLADNLLIRYFEGLASNNQTGLHPYLRNERLDVDQLFKRAAASPSESGGLGESAKDRLKVSDEDEADSSFLSLDEELGITPINSEVFQKLLIQGKLEQEFMVLYHALWCGHCRRFDTVFNPIVQNLLRTLKKGRRNDQIGPIGFYKIDATKNDIDFPNLVITRVPDVRYFKAPFDAAVPFIMDQEELTDEALIAFLEKQGSKVPALLKQKDGEL